MKSNAKTNPADPADKLFLPAKTALDKYLKANGMRRTPERYAILEKVFSTDAHFYVDALHEALTLDGMHLSLSTVYAAVQLFLEAGLVRRHQFGNQPAQYERVPQGGRRAICIWYALRAGVCAPCATHSLWPNLAH